MKHATYMSALVLLALAGCSKTAASPEAAAKVSEADATAAADTAQAAWTSGDVAKIESIYAKDIVGFDPMTAPLSRDWDNWHKLQQGFAAMKFNGISVPDRKIQILDADTFVVSGTGTMTSADGPMKQAPMRFTDVYQKQADGKWLIVNEHVSLPPKETPPKA